MRVLNVVVPADRRDAAREALEEHEFTVTALEVAGREGVLLQTPVPSNAVGDALDALEAAGVATDEYTVVASGEAAMTATSETIERRYVGEYKPLTGVELRAKARDLSRDRGSYAALMILSALIATAGLLVDSPAIVVGSMVIAPIIGPALTASVGAVTGDREMIADSLWMQLYGLGLAVAAGAVLAAGFRFGGFVPAPLSLPSLDLFGVRLAPNALSLVVGAAAGTAAGIGLTTKGPTSIIGVMIAAALIPSAGAAGIAVAFLEPELAIGTTVLLVVTMVVINVSVLTVLVVLGYHERERPSPGGKFEWSRATVAALGLVVAAVTLAVVGATVQQTMVDREIQRAADEALEESGHENLTAVSVRVEYADMSPFTGPREATVVVAQDGAAAPDELAADVAERVERRTGEAVTVRVETVEYESASAG
ncbi:DUF389 domain-containing protein [Salinilacihabitans rarus]|uniref:DUF389 domain-containing protein n=1 Tax=Salinilacihabitans rarus TaxID=2961596 RepID=UPI0020C8BE20|nr:DUF389 domain-containing protein [Salinilacihabitans rarus]